MKFKKGDIVRLKPHLNTVITISILGASRMLEIIDISDSSMTLKGPRGTDSNWRHEAFELEKIYLMKKVIKEVLDE